MYTIEFVNLYDDQLITRMMDSCGLIPNKVEHVDKLSNVVMMIGVLLECGANLTITQRAADESFVVSVSRSIFKVKV